MSPLTVEVYAQNAAAARVTMVSMDVKSEPSCKYTERDSNPHCRVAETRASYLWATGASVGVEGFEPSLDGF